MDFGFTYTLDQSKNQWDISIEGEIDIYNSKQLKEKLYSLLKEKQANLHINCEKLEYIDSTGLGSFVSILKKVKQFNGTIYLSHLKPNVAKVFKITGLNKIFVVEGDAHE